MYLNLTSPFNSNLAKLDGNSNFDNFDEMYTSILSYFVKNIFSKQSNFGVLKRTVSILLTVPF